MSSPLRFKVGLIRLPYPRPLFHSPLDDVLRVAFHSSLLLRCRSGAKETVSSSYASRSIRYNCRRLPRSSCNRRGNNLAAQTEATAGARLSARLWKPTCIVQGDKPCEPQTSGSLHCRQHLSCASMRPQHGPWRRCCCTPTLTYGPTFPFVQFKPPEAGERIRAVLSGA